jgi:hypothetical protein
MTIFGVPGQPLKLVAKIYAITPKNFVILAKILEAKFGCGFAASGIIQAKKII